MSYIFVSRPGHVVRVPSPGDVPMPLAMSGWAGAGAFKAILTEISVAQREDFQIVSSLGDLLYAFAFGRQAGEMRVAGIAFISGCSDDATTGFEYVQRYYDEHCASNRADPVDVVIGRSTHSAFLVGLDSQISRPEGRLCGFGLQFRVIPKRAGS